jgi:hypothetical protein
MKNEMTIEEIVEINAQLSLLVAILELRVKCEKPVHENDKKRLVEAQAAKRVYFEKMFLNPPPLPFDFK